MNQLLQDTSRTTLVQAMEANFAEEMAGLVRALPDGELHDDGEIQWFFTGRPGFNGVLRYSSTSTDKSSIHAKISATLTYFQERRVRIGWRIGPLTYPANLATYLGVHGLTYRSSQPEMGIELSSLRENSATNVQGLKIKEIQDSETLKLWRALTIQGFNSTKALGQTYYEAYQRMGFGHSFPWHHYIGWWYDQPVAVASLLLHAGVAGIYGVTTLPEARQQGIGTAMTAHVLQEARRFNQSIAILSPSKMGMSVYRRLGFQEYYKTHFYQWAPDE